MQIILSHESAMEFWLRQGDLGVLSKCDVPANYSPSIRSGDFARIGLSSPLHIYVPSKSQRRSGGCVSHLMPSELPSKSLVYAGDGLYVCVPALALCQLASYSHSELEIIMRGSQLCGRYSLDPSSSNGLRKHVPLTSSKRILEFAQLNNGLRGAAKVEKAARYMIDGAASPMESKISLLLSLPCRLGGYGLPKPQNNMQVKLSDVAESVMHRESFECDLFWPELGIVLEYDSDAYHATAIKSAQDRRRLEALAMSGYKTHMLTSGLYASNTWMNELADAIAKASKRRLYLPLDHMRRQSELRCALQGLDITLSLAS